MANEPEFDARAAIADMAHFAKLAERPGNEHGVSARKIWQWIERLELAAGAASGAQPVDCEICGAPIPANSPALSYVDERCLAKLLAAHATALSEDWPECEDFYNLMQLYRHSPVVRQGAVIEAYKEVKSWLREQVNTLLRSKAGERG